MIRGLVQGVGFRPFIYRLAVKHGLFGEVRNRTDGVSIVLQGSRDAVDSLGNDIIKYAPPASRVKSIEIRTATFEAYDRFSISESKTVDNAVTEISPDIAVCDECLDDMKNDPGRIDYPFVNCTNCGPRFTIIEAIPYDRPNTTMKSFMMCASCKSEYENILDRRHHAQPIACNNCGPVCNYTDGEKNMGDLQKITDEVSARLASGKAVAVKGLGGYFLMCDALNGDAVTELRRKKHRDAKPFAVMFRDLEAVKSFCFVNDEEKREIASWRRPIVILRQRKLLSYPVSNGLGTTGAMLPYMPLHYLLFKKIKTPAVVFTSGNISDDPIIIDDSLAEKQLIPVAGSLLSYDRSIHNRIDDSVIRVMDNKTCIIRRSRGYVPLPIDLDSCVEGILAVGAEQKSSFCIGKGFQAVMSQYIGDIKSPAVADFLFETIERFSGIFSFKPEIVACDLHPDYMSTGYAEKLGKEMGIPLLKVQHHHAHIASCLAENGINEKVIGVAMDGTGFGIDGNIWGGEFFVADAKGFERVSHFDYIPMPGGDKAVEEPWRMAFSYLFRYFGDSFDYHSIPLFRSVNDQELSLVREMILKNVNSPLTSGAGRLFDAFSALLGLCKKETFDSEAPMRLESAIESNTNDYYPFYIGRIVDFSETFSALLEDIPHRGAGVIAAKMHNTVAQAILKQSCSIRKDTLLNKVILSGGVFQNKYLLEKTFFLLNEEGFETHTNHLVPANDGGISLGQLSVASKLLK
ncbi:MAG: carbamoyltransferase HypF [Bacteroidales bacterium]